MTRSVTLAIGVFLLAAFVQTAPLSIAEEARHAVTGIVKDDQGNPIAGAAVYGYTKSDEGMSESHDKNMTDENGRFTLHLAAGPGHVSASHHDFRLGSTADLVVPLADGQEVSLVLPRPPPRTATVEGRIVDERGEPIPGAQVSIQQECCYAMEDGEHRIQPTPPSSAAPESDGPDAGATTASSGGSGSSASAPTTRPAIWYDGDHQTTTTDADGTYRFETHPGPRQITAHAKGYAQGIARVEALDGQTVTADLTLEKVPTADAVLRVRVVDAATGALIRGASVSAQNVEWSHYAWGETGADGIARITTLPGWTHLSIHYYGHAQPVLMDGGDVAVDKMRAPDTQYYAYAKALRVASGEQPIDAQLEPKPRGTIVLTGYVIDPDAKTGVPNAEVNIWNQDTGDWGNARTDATGSYRFLVRPGHYTMNVWAERHLPGLAMFTIADGEATKRVDVEAPRGEQKYAPCIDGCPEPRPMPAEDVPASSGGSDAGGAGNATTVLNARASDEQALRSAKSNAPVVEADSAGGMAYAGSGGGLPPYQPDDGAGAQSAGDAGARAEVPALGVGAALVLLGLLALARRR